MNVKLANRVRLAVTIVASLILVYALVVSAKHIAHVGHAAKLPAFEANTLFVLIDVAAVVGKILRMWFFSAATRRTGTRLFVMAGTLSLACNVASGWLTGGYGPAAYGVLVVLMALYMEHVVTRIKPAAAVTRAKNAASETKTSAAPARSRKCAPGCTCKKHAARYPVSPGVGPVGTYAGRKA